MSLSTEKLTTLYNSQIKENTSSGSESGDEKKKKYTDKEIPPRYEHLYLHNYQPFIDYVETHPELCVIIDHFNEFKSERRKAQKKILDNKVKWVRIKKDDTENSKPLRVKELRDICKQLGMKKLSSTVKKELFEYYHEHKSSVSLEKLNEILISVCGKIVDI